MSGSIMLAGLTGHVGLPPMYAEMKTPSAFRPTFYLSFLAMLAMYAVVGIGGYLLYGTASHVLITEDMAEAAGKSAFAQFLVTLVLGSITFKLFCGVPLSVLITVDIIQDLYQEGSGQRMSERQADWMRLAIWAGSVVTALAIMPYLQYGLPLRSRAAPCTVSTRLAPLPAPCTAFLPHVPPPISLHSVPAPFDGSKPALASSGT